MRIFTVEGMIALRESLSLGLELYDAKLSPFEAVFCANRVRNALPRETVRMK